MNRKIFIILAHKGMSFLFESLNFLSSFDIDIFVISSKCDEKSHLMILKNNIGDYYISKNEYLNFSEINKNVKLISEKYEVIGCLSATEIYRVYAADINELIGGNDCKAESINLVMDKLKFREVLYRNNLSKIKALRIIDNKIPPTNSNKFIKPRFGTASIGAFLLDSKCTEQRLIDIRNNLMEDSYVNQLSKGNNELIIEDEIKGIEYSFEVISFDGNSYTVASHQKAIDNVEGILQESVFFSPPNNLKEINYLAFVNKIKDVFKLFNLNYGAFHVEAKFYNGYWEIIEINPRIGGTLINESVKLRTTNYSLLDLWILVMLSQSSEFNASNYLFSNIFLFEEMKVKNSIEESVATYLRVFFGKPNGVITQVTENELSITPKMKIIEVFPGYHIDSSKKEYFIGCGLWEIPIKDKDVAFQILDKEAINLFNIEYE